MSRLTQLSQNFKPTGNTVNIAATTSTANVQIVSSNKPRQIAVFNSHTAIVYINFGGASVTATSSNMPIPANGWIIIDAGQAEYVAALAASSSGTIYFTPGVGA